MPHNLLKNTRFIEWTSHNWVNAYLVSCRLQGVQGPYFFSIARHLLLYWPRSVFYRPQIPFQNPFLAATISFFRVSPFLTCKVARLFTNKRPTKRARPADQMYHQFWLDVPWKANQSDIVFCFSRQKNHRWVVVHGLNNTRTRAAIEEAFDRNDT